MADRFIAYDPNANEGERLAPEVRTEIAYIAPSAVVNGSITTAKLADLSVSTGKIVDGAVTGTKITAAAIGTSHLVTAAVTADKLGTDAVTPDKCGTGVPTAVDSSDNPVETVFKFVTAAQYGALTPNSNTVYFIS